MSTSSVEPANQICYIEKPPKPLGTAVNDFIKEQVKAEETGKSPNAANAADKSVQASAADATAPITASSVNGIGQITGQIVSTTA